MATLDGVRLECWLPSGRRQWAVPDDDGGEGDDRGDGGEGGRDIVVASDERSAWVGLKPPPSERCARPVVRLALDDGARLDHLVPSATASLVRSADGLPSLAPAGANGERSRLRIRRGSRIYFRETAAPRSRGNDEGGEARLAAADLGPPADAGRPREPRAADVRDLSPYSWQPGETHFAGPGVETADGDLIHAGTVHDGRGLRPGGSFVVRRAVGAARPVWVFRTDRKATDLDLDSDVVHVTYDDGEIVALDARDGRVLRRRHLTVAGVPVVASALTVAGPGRLLLGTTDGRLLVCSTADPAQRPPVQTGDREPGRL